MEFNFDSTMPLYQQVATQIEAGILQKIFPANTQVPSTTDISTAYRLNPATVLKGMNLLVQEGILEKKRGLGMFVTPEASAIILAKRKKQFTQVTLQTFVNEAWQLDISKKDLQTLIESRYPNESTYH